MHMRRIAFAGVVAALYASMTIVIAPAAYGPIQFRLAEVLCILPFFFPSTALGLFVGCLIANLMSPYGLLDIVAGSSASLIAGLVTMRLGRINKDAALIKAVACFPPVIINALFIGAVIAWSTTSGGDEFRLAFVTYSFQVGLGQFAVMYAIGLPLLIYFPKTHLFKLLFAQYDLSEVASKIT